MRTMKSLGEIRENGGYATVHLADSARGGLFLVRGNDGRYLIAEWNRHHSNWMIPQRSSGWATHVRLDVAITDRDARWYSTITAALESVGLDGQTTAIPATDKFTA